MDSNIATQRKGAGGKKLRTDSFEKCITKIVCPSCCSWRIIKWIVKQIIKRNGPRSTGLYLKVEDETQTDFTDKEAYLREIIDNNNKKIHKLEQEIEELKRQLQDTQRQRDAVTKRLFNFENFYTGFQSWDTLMAVF